MINFEVLVTRYSWLIPILYELVNYLNKSGNLIFSKNELGNVMKVPKRLVRTCIWILQKLKIVKHDVKEGYYELDEEFYKIFSKRVNELNVCKFKNSYIYKFQDLYYLITIKRKRITCRKVSQELILRIIELLKNYENGLTISKIRELINEKADRVCTALKILNLFNIVKKIPENEHVLYKLSVTDPSLINRLIR